MKIWKADTKGAEKEQSLLWLYCPKTTHYYNICDWAKNKIKSKDPLVHLAKCKNLQCFTLQLVPSLLFTVNAQK